MSEQPETEATHHLNHGPAFDQDGELKWWMWDTLIGPVMVIGAMPKNEEVKSVLSTLEALWRLGQSHETVLVMNAGVWVRAVHPKLQDEPGS